MKNLSLLKKLFTMSRCTLTINSAHAAFWFSQFKPAFITYALETIGLSKGTSILDIYMLSNTQLTSNDQSNLLGCLTTLEGNIFIRKDKKEGTF